MSTLSKGSFSINLGIFKVGGDITDADKQCAWELYTEIVTRLAVHGRSSANPGEEFYGEILSESLQSLYNFFGEARGIMRSFPVGKIEKPDDYHLGKFICAMMNDILRPFLERWQGKYRHWVEANAEASGSQNPFDSQASFPDLDAFLKDWSDLRFMMRGIAARLAEEYSLVHVTGSNQ